MGNRDHGPLQRDSFGLVAFGIVFVVVVVVESETKKGGSSVTCIVASLSVHNNYSSLLAALSQCK